MFPSCQNLFSCAKHKMPAAKVKKAWTEAVVRMRNPASALFFAVALVQIFKNSDMNPSGYASMPLCMAEAAAGGAWPFFAPFIGAIGSFITGSNTVSNLLFAEKETWFRSLYTVRSPDAWDWFFHTWFSSGVLRRPRRWEAPFDPGTTGNPAKVTGEQAMAKNRQSVRMTA